MGTYMPNGDYREVSDHVVLVNVNYEYAFVLPIDWIRDLKQVRIARRSGYGSDKEVRYVEPESLEVVNVSLLLPALPNPKIEKTLRAERKAKLEAELAELSKEE